MEFGVTPMDSNFGKLELGKTKLSKWVNKFEEVFESETRGGVDDGRLAFWKFDLEDRIFGIRASHRNF